MTAYTINGVLFDMDGVLIDSNAAIEGFWKQLAAQEKVYLRDEDISCVIHGRTTQDTISELFHHCDENKKNAMLKAAFAFDLDMHPGLIKGAENFLTALRKCISKIGLVTSAPAIRANKMIELHNIHSSFSCMITSDQVKKCKPDPEPYLFASKKMHVLPKNSLVFEDSNSGIRSAIDAGMYVIAVNNTEHKHDNIIGNITDYDSLTVKDNNIHFKHSDLKIQLS